MLQESQSNSISRGKKAEDTKLERIVAFQLRQECHVYSTRSNRMTKTP
jgi:hypothetical protein